MLAKYDIIGRDYNQTRKADPYLAEQLFQYLNPIPDGIYLDIGCGTGNYTHVFQQKGHQFIGIDPSENMLAKAQLNNPSINWKLGTAEQTGLADSSVDGIIASLTVHHWTDLKLAFQDLYRVLKAPGRIVIFTATPQQMEGYWLKYYFPKMLKDSIQQMPSRAALFEAMSIEGFSIDYTVPYEIQPDLQDLFLYCGKEQPEYYLDPAIRNGISSFSHLAHQTEVVAGLTQLEADIRSGKIKEIMQAYENEWGDYLFLIGKK